MGSWLISHAPKLEAVLVRPLIAGELLREPLVVPDLEVVDLAEDATSPTIEALSRSSGGTTMRP